MKTEQVILNLLSFKNYGKETVNYHIRVFALPYKPRKEREIFFNHRPNQNDAVTPKILCHRYNLEYIECDSDISIDDSCDVYLITGAGILSAAAVKGKKIINCHPGIVPSSRGLDSFKWAIMNMLPLGNTLHYIDENVDMGEIITIIETPVFSTDSIETLARRHYESEIQMLSNFEYYVNNTRNNFSNIEMRDSTKRMSFETEVIMYDMFEKYKDKYSNE